MPSPITAPGEDFRFDFWSWRRLRRSIVDLMLNLVRTPAFSPGDAAKLRSAAWKIASESITQADVEELSRLLVPRSSVTLQSNFDLLTALIKNRPADFRIDYHGTWGRSSFPSWKVAAGTPAYPFIFSGQVDMTSVTAVLPPSRFLVPPPVVVFLPSPDSPISAGRAYTMGPDMEPVPPTPNAAAAWDWLFTRRLSWLCQQGFLAWPGTPDPIVLATSGFMRLPRPL